MLLGGTGLFASANYGRILSVKPNYFLEASIGIGTVPFVGGLVFPHKIIANFGKNKNFIEVGIGGSFWSGKSNSSGFQDSISSYLLSPIVGWRHNFANNLIFKAYGNLLIHIADEYYYENEKILPYCGVGLGYSF